MADDFSSDIPVVDKAGKATPYGEDYLFQLTRSIGLDTPSSASDAGVKGTILADSSYIYVCVDTDTWLRVAIATW